MPPLPGALLGFPGSRRYISLSDGYGHHPAHFTGQDTEVQRGPVTMQPADVWNGGREK